MKQPEQPAAAQTPERTDEPVQESTPQAVQDAAQLQDVPSAASPLPSAPELPHQQDTGAAERVMEHIDAAHTRKASKKAAQRAQREAAAKEKSSRLQFTDEELATPELEKYVKKSNEAADRLDAARAAIPKEKKLIGERTFDEATGKGKTRLRFEEREKPINGGKSHSNPLSRPAQEAGVFVHNKIHSVEKDNSGVEGAHKSEELAERGAKYGARKVREGYRSHKLKPTGKRQRQRKRRLRQTSTSSTTRRCMTTRSLRATPFPLPAKAANQAAVCKGRKDRRRSTAKKAAENTRKAAKKTAEEMRKAAAFAARHPAGIAITVAALLLFIMVSAGLSSCGAMFSGLTNGVLGTSYTSEDSDLVATENNYAAKENELQQRIDSIERDYPGYDEYRYDLDSIGHNPHELASHLTALLQSYTPQSAQAELDRVFNRQYELTLTEEVEIRYRTETSTDRKQEKRQARKYYEYYILNVTLTNHQIDSFVSELLNAEQLEMYRVYLETSGNKPLIFGAAPRYFRVRGFKRRGFVNGTRPGNTAIVELAKQQVGNVGGRPYWSWYGFSSRVEWCACFVSWCYGQMAYPSRALPPVNHRGFRGLPHAGNGARGAMRISPPATLSFSTGI